MADTGHGGYEATAIVDGRRYFNRDICNAELHRARHGLAYLKGKLSNEAMRRLLDEDLQAMTAQVRGWVEASHGAWQSASMHLIVPGPSASR